MFAPILAPTIEALIFPEVIVAVISLAVVIMCIYSWKKGDTSALGTAVPFFYLFCLYLVFVFSPDIPDVARRFWVRLGVVLLGIEVLIEKAMALKITLKLKLPLFRRPPNGNS